MLPSSLLRQRPPSEHSTPPLARFEADSKLDLLASFPGLTLGACRVRIARRRAHVVLVDRHPPPPPPRPHMRMLALAPPRVHPLVPWVVFEEQVRRLRGRIRMAPFTRRRSSPCFKRSRRAREATTPTRATASSNHHLIRPALDHSPTCCCRHTSFARPCPASVAVVPPARFVGPHHASTRARMR